MRTIPWLKLPLLCLILFISLSFGVTAQDAPQARGYRYSYFDYETYHLHLLDPESGIEAQQSIPLPIETDDFFQGMEISPNGEWIAMIIGPDHNKVGSLIRVFNVLTGEILETPPRLV